jgi:hypothetical protein
MARIRLIHWHPAEAEERATLLRAAGHEVNASSFDRSTLRTLSQQPPEAIVIDLARLPSQGRDVGLNLRLQAGTRHVPLIFLGGDRSKLPPIQALLPDATYTTWDRFEGDLARALEQPPGDPVVPESAFAAYAHTPLPKKLGIKASTVVALAGAPAGFETALEPLPEGATIHRDGSAPRDLTLWFVHSQEELVGDVAGMVRHSPGGGLWILWPKKASGVDSDLSQPVVRQAGLAAGMVDFKICAVDETWSGLRFSRRQG